MRPSIANAPAFAGALDVTCFPLLGEVKKPQKGDVYRGSSSAAPLAEIILTAALHV